MTQIARAGVIRAMVEVAMASNKVKVNTEIKKIIIEKAIEGKTSGQISQYIKEMCGVDVSDARVREYRIKFKDKIVPKREEILNSAYATEPLARPEYRLKLYHENIERETGRKNSRGKYTGDGKVINDALRYAAEDLKNLEMIQLKQKEIELRKELGESVADVDGLLVMVEKRIVVGKKKSEVNEQIAEDVQWAIVDSDATKEKEDGGTK